MGADIKQLRTRIKSVDSSLHLTKAMGLVAASKIRRANEEMFKSQEYAEALGKMIRELSGSPECRKSPFMRAEEESSGSSGSRVRLVVIAGDRGMAGGYNANIFRMLKSYPDAEVFPIGKRICDRMESEFVSSETFSSEEAFDLAHKMCDDYAKGEYDRLGILCTKYINMMSQEAEIRWILPVTAEAEVVKSGMVFEPDERTVLDAAVPEYVAGMFVAAIRESFASEVAARRIAMDSAEKNARQMIDSLELEYNRARQSNITQEITEIVAGSGR
ncbi:F-type H+-transporting ATPase subunit gamma [Ruminococcaceae bacterium YRB3002]|nr:F-type H+-transporting ATPase subunit gamma [Ruminococcaceae bacterium YRB3002]